MRYLLIIIVILIVLCMVSFEEKFRPIEVEQPVLNGECECQQMYQHCSHRCNVNWYNRNNAFRQGNCLKSCRIATEICHENCPLSDQELRLYMNY